MQLRKGHPDFSTWLLLRRQRPTSQAFSCGVKSSQRCSSGDAKMQRISVDSSSIATIGYDPEQRIMELEFRQTREVYQYFDVPPEEHEAFMQAESKGTYLNKEFKLRGYRYARVEVQRKQAS
jgi:hypothetical protein